MIQVTAVCRLTRDPEVVKVGDTKLAKFGVADNKRIKKGEHPEANFMDVEAWGAQADFVATYFHKGDYIGIAGPIDIQNYENRDGEKRTKVVVKATDINFIGSKSMTPAQESHPAKRQAPKEDIAEDSDELPF